MSIAELNCDIDYELDCEIYDEEFEGNEADCAQFQDPFLLQRIYDLAKKCLNKYFEGKFCYDGTKLDSKHLDDSKFVDLIVKTNIITAVDKAYSMIERNNFCASVDNGKTMPEDVTYIVSLIHKIQRVVPQDFVGGTLLIHLNLIEGLSFD